MKGILFTADMIKAIREGRKTRTRRVIKLRGKVYKFMREHGYNSIQHDGVIYPDGGGNWIGWDKDSPGLAEFTKKAYPNGEGFKSPYQVGDIVYIKEAWWEDSGDIYFKSDFADGQLPTNMYFEKGKWKSPLFLPEIFARDFIKIINVKPQRLQEITEEDAIAEGAPAGYILASPTIFHKGRPEYTETPKDYRAGFQRLWNSINGKKSPWDKNDWVWAYTFERVNTQEVKDAS